MIHTRDDSLNQHTCPRVLWHVFQMKLFLINISLMPYMFITCVLKLSSFLCLRFSNWNFWWHKIWSRNSNIIKPPLLKHQRPEYIKSSFRVQGSSRDSFTLLSWFHHFEMDLLQLVKCFGKALMQVEFFEFYGRSLNIKDVGISCRDGGHFFKKKERG